eukprot:scaffold754_cov248-Pinguiococcus_pyrenoidosus.AAC.13
MGGCSSKSASSPAESPPQPVEPVKVAAADVDATPSKLGSETKDACGDSSSSEASEVRNSHDLIVGVSRADRAGEPYEQEASHATFSEDKDKALPIQTERESGATASLTDDEDLERTERDTQESLDEIMVEEAAATEDEDEEERSAEAPETRDTESETAFGPSLQQSFSESFDFISKSATRTLFGDGSKAKAPPRTPERVVVKPRRCNVVKFRRRLPASARPKALFSSCLFISP